MRPAPDPRPITGTHLYTLPRCARAVALDLWAPRDERRPPLPEEEFLLARGRAREAEVVAELGWPQPEFAQGDYAAGARATTALLRAGVDGVLQGVLIDRVDGRLDLLGIPDLLRRVDGASALGDFHYEVGDVKSSMRPRGDQILQIAFYSHLLALVQDREPREGFLLLRDGTEERIALHEFRPAFDDALDRVRQLREAQDRARPTYGVACRGCRWSNVCVPQMEGSDDLSLVDGITEGLRTMFEIAGIRTAAALARANAAGLARDTHVEPALVRRLVRAARARADATAIAEERANSVDATRSAFVTILTDAWLDRAVAIGVARRVAGRTQCRIAIPRDRAEEWPAFRELVAELPSDMPLLHFGRGVTAWFARRSDGQPDAERFEKRWVDLERRLRCAAAWPRKIVDRACLVELGLGRDAARAGRSGQAAMWAQADDEAALRANVEADLDDLVTLTERWLLGVVPASESRA
jgi:predicted RecB family nuclease